MGSSLEIEKNFGIRGSVGDQLVVVGSKPTRGSLPEWLIVGSDFLVFSLDNL